jgi:transposase-like protein
MRNIVIRQCNKCGNRGIEDANFSYCGDSIWMCHICLSKYTHISEIIDPDNNVKCGV